MPTYIELSNFNDSDKASILGNVNPKISSITYPSGSSVSTSGGETVTVTGSNFLSGVSIYVGSTASPSVTLVSSTTLTFTAPAKTSGNKQLFVMNSNGRAGEYFDGITYS